jgi:hypothetical protein
MEVEGVDAGALRRFVEFVLNPLSLAIVARGIDDGIFEALAAEPRGLAELGAAIGAEPGSVGLEMTVELGRGLGLFAGDTSRIELGELSRRFLTQGSSLRLLGLVDHYRRYLPAAASLPEALRRTPRAKRTMWRPGAEREEHRAYFAARQAYNESRRDYFHDTAYLLLRGHLRHGLGQRRRLCDVGAGPGAFACLVKKCFPAIDAIAVDVSFSFDAYRERSQAVAAAEGIDVAFVGANALLDPLPEGVDVITLNRLISGVPRDGADAWIERAFAALAPGGVLAMVDMVMSGDPEHDRLVALVVAQWMAKDRYLIAGEPPTDPNDDKHQWGWSPPWRGEELEARLRAHGFVDTFTRAADPPFTLVGGIRP